MSATHLFEVAIRVDASPEIGGGHLMRCLTLADALRDAGAGVVFLCQDLPGSSSLAQVERSGFEAYLLPQCSPEQDAAETCAILQRRGLRPDWLVVDHYDLGADWQRELAPHVGQILALEDIPGRPHVADAVLDPTFGRKADDYAGLTPKDCRLLLGTDYALIRPEFAALRPATLARRALQTTPERLLISLGSGETSGELLTILAALAQPGLATDLNITLVLGGPQHEEDRIRAAAKALPTHVDVLGYADNMPALMAEADIAIGAAGGSTWERCCLGLPSIVMSLADNQVDIARQLQTAGAAFVVSPEPEDIHQVLKTLLADPVQLSENAARLCDARGTKRVKAALMLPLMSVRLARLEDAQFIWDARNGDDAILHYRNSSAPEFEDHLAWLETALADPLRILWIAQLGSQDIGHVRLDCHGPDQHTAEISLYMPPAFRGMGLGPCMLSNATQRAFDQGIEMLTAEVHSENTASRHSFEAADYQRTDVGADRFLTYKKTPGF